MRKRDPRYKAHISNQAQSRSTPQGSSTPSQSVPPPVPHPAFVEQEWQKASSRDADADLDWAAGEGTDDEEWECVACGKSFRTEAAWDSHERSKKHLKAVEALKREMELDDEQLELDMVEGGEPPISDSELEESVNGEETVSLPPVQNIEPHKPHNAGSDGTNDASEQRPVNRRRKGKTKEAPVPSSPSKTEKMSRLRNTQLGVAPPGGGIEETEMSGTRLDATAPVGPSKRDKRRAREVAKKAKALNKELVSLYHLCYIKMLMSKIEMHNVPSASLF